METDTKKQRQHFYRDYASGQWSMSELCDRYQISRPSGYKWIERIETEGLKAVDDRSRAPNRHPNRTPEHVEREILVLREKYGWGAAKLRQIMKRRHPSRSLPARSTVNALLDRHGQLERDHRPIAELRAELGTERRTKRARATRDQRRRLARDGVLAPEEVGRLVAGA